MLLAHQARICVRLAGDWHHYVRESTDENGRGAHLVTCGTGGAFTHPTHCEPFTQAKSEWQYRDQTALNDSNQKARIVGVANGTPEHCSNPLVYGSSEVIGSRTRFPDRKDSVALSRQNIWALFRSGNNRFGSRAGFWSGNIVFCLLLGVLYWFAGYANSIAFSHAFAGDDFTASECFHTLAPLEAIRQWGHAVFFSPFALLVNVVLLVLCMAVARELRTYALWIWNGLAHFAAHWLCAALLYWLAAKAAHAIGPAYGEPVLRGALHGAFGMLAGGVLFGLYFAAMAWWGWLPNNAYSTIAHEGHKGFLRFRIAADGGLTAWFIGSDAVPTRWKAIRDGNLRPVWEAVDQGSGWRVVDRFDCPP